MAFNTFPSSANTHFSSMFFDSRDLSTMQLPIYSDPALGQPLDAAVDPTLEYMSSLPSVEGSQEYGVPPAMQRFMKEDRSAIFKAPDATIAPSASFHYHQHEISPLPQPSLYRQSSPFSQQPSYSSASEGQSPHTEVDFLPATPPDLSAASPYSHPSQSFDQWALPNAYTLGCVKLDEVNPMVDFDEVGLDPPSRSFSFTSCESQVDPEPQAQPASLFPAGNVHPDNEPPAQEEIHAYPEPEADAASDVDQKPEAARLTSEDKEWKPRSSKKRPRPSDQEADDEDDLRNALQSQRSAQKEARMARKKAKALADYPFVCPDCEKPTGFDQEAALEKHMAKKHRRPFPCIFRFAGCPAVFGSKNEWKRHTTSQHIVLQYWLCTEDTCCKMSSATSQQPQQGPVCPVGAEGGSSSLDTTSVGSVFNRKDLYTQHVRRMHVPMCFRRQLKQKKHIPEWEKCLKTSQTKARRTRCDLPTRMLCPVPTCNDEFLGANAWDDRMEHLATHLDRAAIGDEPEVPCGGDADVTLTAWAMSPEVNILRKTSKGGWELTNPLRGGTLSSAHAAKRREGGSEISDVDADGEDE